MPKNFWLQLAIQEALVVAEGVIAAQSSLTPQQKQDLEAFVAAGQKVAQDF